MRAKVLDQKVADAIEEDVLAKVQAAVDFAEESPFPEVADLHKFVYAEDVLGMTEITYREALRDALIEEMDQDPNVFIMGEEVGVFQGAYKVTEGLLDRFGEKRVVDTPIAEEGFIGIGTGAAMTGLRPVVELMTINFGMVAMDQIANHAAKISYMFGGRLKCPMVIRAPGGGASAAHSATLPQP